MTYFITGATGAVGRSVVAQLQAAGHKVRIVTRDPAKIPAGVDAIVGDFSRGNFPSRAFDDVRSVFLFPAQGGVKDFLDQAKRAGVEHLVVLSSLAAAFEHERDRNSPGALHHQRIEGEVRDSGIAATIVRPGTFANNLLFWAHSIRHGDTVYGPYGQSAQAPIHEADIAAVAAAALTQDGHQGKTYHLTGPQALTRVEQLNAIGGAIGKVLYFREISPESFQSEMEKYMPLPIIKMLLDYWSDTVERPDRVLSTIEKVTGAKARTLADWAIDHAADFSPS
jgi:uncharacterized protein YbjT (DUF2867 family)